MNVNHKIFTFVKIAVMESIVERVEIILRTKNLSPSKFADEIGVQRSSISHIMSGRNKPSLDFVIKVLDSFNDISAEWLIKGLGTMNNSELKFELEEPIDTGEINQLPEKRPEKPAVSPKMIRDRKISKVLVFYNDQTFEEIKSSD